MLEPLRLLETYHDRGCEETASHTGSDRNVSSWPMLSKKSIFQRGLLALIQPRSGEGWRSEFVVLASISSAASRERWAPSGGLQPKGPRRKRFEVLDDGG